MLGLPCPQPQSVRWLGAIKPGIREEELFVRNVSLFLLSLCAWLIKWSVTRTVPLVLTQLFAFAWSYDDNVMHVCRQCTKENTSGLFVFPLENLIVHALHFHGKQDFSPHQYDLRIWTRGIIPPCPKSLHSPPSSIRDGVHSPFPFSLSLELEKSWSGRHANPYLSQHLGVLK